MSTLKINTARTYWITGVSNIIELGTFIVHPPTGNESPEVADNPVYAAADAAGVLDGYHVVQAVEFEHAQDGYDQLRRVNGVAIVVERERYLNTPRQVWLIPQRSAYLMSDSGATIDRI